MGTSPHISFSDLPESVNPSKITTYIVQARTVAVKMSLTDILEATSQMDPEIQKEMQKIVQKMLYMIKEDPTVEHIGHLFDYERIGSDGTMPTATLTFNHELNIGDEFHPDHIAAIPHRMH